MMVLTGLTVPDLRGMCLCNECVNMTSAKTDAKTEQESDMIDVPEPSCMCLCNECMKMTSAKTDAQTGQSDMVARAHCCSSYYHQNFDKKCFGLYTCVLKAWCLIGSLSTWWWWLSM